MSGLGMPDEEPYNPLGSLTLIPGDSLNPFLEINEESEGLYQLINEHPRT